MDTTNIDALIATQSYRSKCLALFFRLGGTAVYADDFAYIKGGGWKIEFPKVNTCRDWPWASIEDGAIEMLRRAGKLPYS